MSSTSPLVRALDEAALRAPHAAAVYLPQGRSGRGAAGWRAVTNAQLHQRSRAIAAGLGALGLQPGDRCVLLVPPTADFFALLFGMTQAGVVPVLVDPGIGRQHLATCLAEARPVGFIGTPKAHAARVLLRWAPTARRLVLAGLPPGARRPERWLPRSSRRSGRTGSQIATLAEVEGLAPGHRPAGAVSGTAAILFTSGSTGPPKGVEYTHDIFSAQVAALGDLYGLGPADTQVATFPPFALFGPALGMPTVIPRMDPTRPAFVDPRNIVEAVQSFHATVMFGSPALLDTVSRWAQPRGVRLPGLRLVMSAGAPVSRRIVEATAAMLDDDARLVTPYGATEALPVASVDHRVLLDAPSPATDRTGGQRGHGVRVGRPAPGVDVGILRLTDDALPEVSDDDLLAPGEIGEILVRGGVVTASYFGRPEATAAAKTRWDGALAHRMGDVGYIDDDGELWFCGRTAHLVHTAAGPRATVPVEVVFNDHPQVARTALLGMGPAGQQRLCVAVELAPGASPEAVLADLRRLAAGHDHTADVTEFRVHPGFPVDIRHNAKIDYAALRAWWEAA